MSRAITSILVRAGIAALAFTPLLASAAAPTNLPEPGTWALVGIGLVAAIAVSRKNRK
jgi:hypothetical protein